MSKRLELQIAGERLVLEFNMVFGEQIMKRLGTKQPTPEAIMAGIVELNEKSTFLMYKAIIYCGMLGYDYIQGYEPKYTEPQVAELINKCDAKQLEQVFNTLTKELGFDLTGKVDAAPKPQSKKKS